MNEKEYLTAEFAKLMTVIDAAHQNRACHTKVDISTDGHDPSASVSIEAYVLKTFLKPPR